MGTQAQNDEGNTVLIKDSKGKTLTTATVFEWSWGKEAVTDISDFGKNTGFGYTLYINDVAFRFDNNVRNDEGELVAWEYLPTVANNPITILTISND